MWEIIVCPELQRLREVRLCNVSSLCLTGGANISRYEHSLGTAHLALACTEAWPHNIEGKTRRWLVLAALLHDVGSTAFGHSVQYVLDLRGYEHESLFDILRPEVDSGPESYRYQHARAEPIYFGMTRRLGNLVSDEDLKAVSEVVAGRGPLGPLINGTIDLDNIDNVYRLAYHIGLTHSVKTPLELARSISVTDGELVVRDSALDMLEDWYETRRTLYRYLLLNPEEFSAKCMLQEALESAQERSLIAFYWQDVDYQLLEKLAGCSAEVSAIVSRLVLGDLYGCLGIYSTCRMETWETLANPPARRALEKDLREHIRKLDGRALKKAEIALHAIKDVDKTQRQIRALTPTGRRITIGVPTRRLLLGVFFKNVHLSMSNVKEENLENWTVRRVVRDRLTACLKDPNIQELVPYGEISDTRR
jgi:HD superfamily phosphohydrolase